MTERVRLDPVDRHALPADLDDRDEGPVAALERLDAGDVDLVDDEPELGREVGELAARPIAQVAVAGDIEGDAQG